MPKLFVRQKARRLWVERMESEFQEAVNRVSLLALANAYQPGKQALGDYAGKVDCEGSKRFTGSIDLDSALKSSYPDSPRWDYGLGLQTSGQEIAVWVEVHPAHTSNVREVLNKLDWLKGWLQSQANALWRLTVRNRGRRYFWLATKGVHIRPGTPQARQLSRAGLELPREWIVFR